MQYGVLQQQYWFGKDSEAHVYIKLEKIKM